MKKNHQSAKVYVFDFHFESDNKEAIGKKKDELDKYFEELRNRLVHLHTQKGSPVQQIFLRKH